MITIASPRTIFAAAAITTCLLAAGCSSSKGAAHSTPIGTTSSANQDSASSQTAAGTTITIKNFAFTVSGDATNGSMVMVTNNDSETHTVTADSGDAFNVTIAPGRTEMFSAPAAVGVYKFHCNFHSTMHGTLIVRN